MARPTLCRGAGPPDRNYRRGGVGQPPAPPPSRLAAARLPPRADRQRGDLSRTLAYGLLTPLLGGGYAVVILGLGQLLGRESPLVVAGATLAVAAVFQPARRRVQAVVDQRFNRPRALASP